jgi:hypothetical protein
LIAVEAFLMIRHIVMFKFKESEEGREKAGNMAALKAMLEALPAKVEEIRSFEVGVNFFEGMVAYDVVLVSEFESVEALYSYQKHPMHLKVADFVSKACTGRVVVDYVI